jgi:hypothetical protein
MEELPIVDCQLPIVSRQSEVEQKLASAIGNWEW